MISTCDGKFPIDELYEMYKEAIEMGYIEEVRTAISKDIDINLPINGKHPIVVVCTQGFWEILDLLLKHQTLIYDFDSIDSLLCIVAKNLTKDLFNDTKSNFKLCFERLLEDPRIDVNLTDYHGNTPLHYTVKFKYDTLTTLLLERGAYIGLKNLKKKLPIDGIDYQILKDFFDTCMYSNYDNHMRLCNDFDITLNYSFLIKKPIKNNIFSQNTDQFYPIEFISQSEQLKELILHPLIRYLIWMKYQTISLFFVWNTILFFIFLLTIIYITFFNMEMDTNYYDQHKFIIFVTKYSTIFCILVIAATLVVQIPLLIDVRINSFMLWRFLNEFCITCLLTIVLIIHDLRFLNLDVATTINLKKQATAICILLIAVDMNLLLITIPAFQKISLHFLMLQKISREFVEVFLCYLTFLFAFSLAFYILENKQTTNESIITNFSTLGQIFIRIIGMMIGELNLSFKSSLIIYYVVTLLFIFLITIVLINLLNGLAVSDVSEIRLKAKLVYLTYRLQLIVCYDKYFLRHVFLRKYLFQLFQRRPNLLFISYLKLALTQYVKEVILYPNKGLTVIKNISKPFIEPDNVDETEWRLMNKKILNELVQHFKNQMEVNDKENRDYELGKTTKDIIKRLIRIELNQKMCIPDK